MERQLRAVTRDQGASGSAAGSGAGADPAGLQGSNGSSPSSSEPASPTSSNSSAPLVLHPKPVYDTVVSNYLDMEASLH